MKTIMLRKLKNSKGMTLMEILIVIAIIGFLASILYPQIQSARTRAQIKQTKISIGQLSQALNNYNIDCNKYPATLDLLTKPDPECSNWGPEPYLKRIPRDEWGHDFAYEVTGTSFKISSPGYKGKEINSDDL